MLHRPAFRIPPSSPPASMQEQSASSRPAGLHTVDQLGSMTRKNMHERGPAPAHPRPHSQQHHHHAALDEDEHAEEEEEMAASMRGAQRLSLSNSASAAASSAAPSMAHSATSAIAAGEEENATMVKVSVHQPCYAFQSSPLSRDWSLCDLVAHRAASLCCACACVCRLV